MDNNDVAFAGTGAWASISSWLTPKILFCVLNMTIATIFVSSNFKSRSKRHQNDGVYEHNHRPLARSPSLLQRVSSFDFSFFPHNHYQGTLPPTHDVTHAPPQLQRSPSLLDRVKNFDFSVSPPNPTRQQDDDDDAPPQLTRVPSLLERVKSIKLSLYGSHLTDPVPDDHPVEESKSKEKKVAKRKMKKSASVKPCAQEKEAIEEEEKRRPATTRPTESASLLVDDQEVDAKADDFINKFRHQLKLQRLDSLLRYRDILNRGLAPQK